MERDNFTSVAELDAFLNEEFSAKEETVEEPVVEEEAVEEEEETLEESEPDAEETSEEEEEQEPVVEEPQKPKRTKEEKRDYAFEKLRKAKAEAEAEKSSALQEKEAYERVLKTLMKESGYTDFDEFKTAVEKQMMSKEIEERGITEEEYKQERALKDREARLQAKEEELSKREYAERARKFDDEVRTFATQYELGEKGVDAIYKALESEGYTAKELIEARKPSVLIKGAMVDLIKQKTVSEHIDTKATRKRLDSGKLTGVVPEKSVEQLQAEMLKKDLQDYENRKRGL